MAIAAFAVASTVGIVYLRFEYPEIAAALRKAIEEAEENGVLGHLRLYARRGAGAYICGEETSLLNSLEGRRPWPRERPPFPPTHGLFGQPTLVNNVETLASVPAIIERGGEWHRALGVAEAAGTKLYSLSGRVRRPGNYELPLGTTAGELIAEHGGGAPEGRDLKAFTLAGVSGGMLPVDALRVRLDYRGPREWGSALGSGGVIVFDDESCLVDEALQQMRFFERESCGKCFPCRIGTVRLRELLEELCGVRSRDTEAPDMRAQFGELAAAMTHASACGLGMAAPLAVTSLVRHFGPELEAHVQGRCPTDVCPV
jgi:NADP-reducing hydrogenase subunit HndC